MFSLGDFLKTALPSLVLLLPIILGVVDWLGKLGVVGKAQAAASMAVGVVIGGLLLYVQSPPESVAGWFAVVLFGLLAGLSASGCYNAAKSASAKGTASALGAPLDTPPDDRLPV